MHGHDSLFYLQSLPHSLCFHARQVSWKVEINQMQTVLKTPLRKKSDDPQHG